MTQLLHQDELNYLNREHRFPLSWAGAAPQSSWIGRVRGRVQRWLREAVFGEYFSVEAEFHAHLVRCLNELSRTVDSRSFRLDDTWQQSLHALERSLSEGAGESARAAQAQLTAVENRVGAQDERLKTLESVCAGLERIVASLGSAAAPADGFMTAEQHTAGQNDSVPDYSYLLLENRYRGSEAEIADRLSRYVPLFKDVYVGAPVLEIGAGRGELQRLFRDADITSYGVELDDAMVRHAAGSGIDIRLEDGLAHLSTLPDASLGGVIAVQVIEHLSRSQLSTLLQLCAKKVRKGGRVVFETINTESIVALAHNYFRDPTHVWPLHPETMRYLMELKGLRVITVEKHSAYPPGAVLQEVAIDPYMTPRWATVVERLNHNVHQLNHLLYDHQDYFICGEPA